MKKIMAVCKPDWKMLRAFLLCIGAAALILAVFSVPAEEPIGQSVYTLAADSPDLARPEKTAYLTFDDGPSSVTADLLNTLKEKQVRASFFVIGTGSSLRDEERNALWKREADEGHMIGLHTWDHGDYRRIYASADAYIGQLKKLQDAVSAATGKKAVCYRFPGGSSNHFCPVSAYREITARMKKDGLEYYDWNVDAEDAIGVHTTADSVAAHVIREAKKLQTPVILMHDIPTCRGSVEAVGRIIDALREACYDFDTVDHLKKPVHQRVKGA